ncbi:MAG: hypothetical protein M3P51_08950 [Chloroflexota bacterium]|nr:hypothetical protein [Chloroflexota bacterium]
MSYQEADERLVSHEERMDEIAERHSDLANLVGGLQVDLQDVQYAIEKLARKTVSAELVVSPRFLVLPAQDSVERLVINLDAIACISERHEEVSGKDLGGNGYDKPPVRVRLLQVTFMGGHKVVLSAKRAELLERALAGGAS